MLPALRLVLLALAATGLLLTVWAATSTAAGDAVVAAWAGLAGAAAGTAVTEVAAAAGAEGAAGLLAEVLLARGRGVAIALVGSALKEVAGRERRWTQPWLGGTGAVP